VYELTDKINIRASYSQTVSRPEFRELASFQFFDFNDLLLVEGNSNLQRTKISNYDVRFEWYPTAGQVVSFSLFYKAFNNPIEKILFSGGSPRIMTYQNVPSAVNYGVEFDYKLNLGRLLNTQEGHFLSEFNLLGNFAYIQSKVDLSNVIAKETNERPLQGQSPYIINTGIQYAHPKQSWGASFMLNRIGERITNAGNSEYASYWERPRTIIDLQFNKTVFKNLDLRFGIRDLLAQNIIFYQNKDNNQVFEPTKDSVIWSYKVGSSYSISATYKF
jgi:outer membrane receptor protein involved in Fe transport